MPNKISSMLIISLVIFSVLEGSICFEIEPGCQADGKNCKQDIDCCSKWCQYGGPYLSSKCAAVSNCGGNCPGANCRGCLCQTAKQIIDVNAYCTPTTSGWSQTCCKCLVNLISGGNARYQRFRAENEIGVIPIRQSSFTGNPCVMPYSTICDWEANKKCAETIYAKTGNWIYWDNEAAKCGCYP